MSRRIGCTFLLIISSMCKINGTQVVSPIIIPRSQGTHAERRLVGITNLMQWVDYDDFCKLAWVSPTYSQSCNTQHVVQALFGDYAHPNHNCATITLAGSQVADRAADSWLADYFYLPSDFTSNITFKPHVDNLLFDLGIFINLGNWWSGLYVTLAFPIVHTRWDINFHEQVINAGVNNYEPGYLTSDSQGVPRPQLLKNFSQYASGQTITPSPNQNFVQFQPLTKATITGKKHIRTRIADVRATLGTPGWQNSCGHIGFFLQGAAPTGNKPEGKLFFEAIVGNGSHWEFGGGVDAAYRLWQSQDALSSCNILLNGTISHLFGRRCTRTFDLQDKPFSRYMLAQRMTKKVQNLTTSSAGIPTHIPEYQYTNQFAPLANLTTFDVNTSIAIQADIVLMCNYSRDQLSVDIGYNFWGRSAESLTPIFEKEPLLREHWALKGTAHVYGYTTGSELPVALSATESQATITRGNSASVSTSANNAHVDTPAPAFTANAIPLVSSPTSATQINTSVFPDILAMNDIALVRTQGLSSTLFAHINYTFIERETSFMPFIGIGAEIEWSHEGPRQYVSPQITSPCPTNTVRCTLSQWSVWIKGGATFN